MGLQKIAWHIYADMKMLQKTHFMGFTGIIGQSEVSSTGIAVQSLTWKTAELFYWASSTVLFCYTLWKTINGPPKDFGKFKENFHHGATPKIEIPVYLHEHILKIVSISKNLSFNCIFHIGFEALSKIILKEFMVLWERAYITLLK